jgi:general secretion pathway protein D
MGIFAPDGTPLSSSLPSSGSSTTTTTTSTGSSSTISGLIRAFQVNGYGGFVTAPSGTYNLAKTLSKGEVLSNPKVRIKNKEKSKFTVGTRVPITTTTTTNTTTSVNVQYVDVGVKVNAEPTIQLNDEVTIKLSLEVSSILSTETVGGAGSATSVVTIGTRNLETVLSLKDGETSVIGGLISRTNTNDKTKIFLLGDLPLIGPLLSNNNDSKSKTELVLAITPRLVRGVTVPQIDLAAFMSGKEDEPSLVRPLGAFEEEPVFATDANVSSPKAEQPPKAADRERQAKAAADQERMAAERAQQGLQAPSPAVGSAPSGDPDAGAGPGRGMIQIVAPTGITVGQQFSVDAKISLVQKLAGTPFTLTYDPSSVEFVSAAEGTFLNQDGKPTNFSASPDATGGTVTITMARTAGSGGVSGGGKLATFTFKAKKQGITIFRLGKVNFTSADGVPFDMMPFVKSVDIR